ncbi:hypothetical protein [uncultured Imperialibacter sp.]|uniref:hypothetical protein n=1 Tax=uncultured Imperialibacter sp. TaxID=1672639 RepID=UPI0030D7F9AF|tara:strand:+ start:9133 stop:9690 length:558 start_codon:yes stop_codon:yes gene_type:complete
MPPPKPRRRAKKTRKEESIPWWGWVLIVFGVVLVILIFVGSLGMFDASTKDILPPEFTDSKEEALKKNVALKEEIDKLTLLKERLDRRFRIVYFFVRIALVIVTSISIYFESVLLRAQTLEDFLNFYEFSIIILFAMNFIAFGTIANFNDFIHLLKAKIENWVWRRNLDLPKQIKNKETELTKLG